MDFKTKTMVFSLGATNFILTLANTMLFPIFPQMRQALDVSLREISLLVTIVALPAAALSPIGGILADVLGRKKVMVPSIILYGLSGGLIGLLILIGEQPFGVILALRFLQGVGSAAPMYLAMALAGDIFQDESRTRAMGLIEMSNGLGKLLSPIIGGTLGLLVWYAPFFLFPAISLPIALVILLYVDEPAARSGGFSLSDIKVGDKMLKATTILILITGTATIASLTGSMFWLSEAAETLYPEGTAIHGLIISLPVAGMMGAALLSPRFTSKLGPRPTMLLGLMGAAGTLIFIPILSDSFLLWPVIALLGISAGTLLPMLDTVATAVASRGHRGIVTTIFGSFRCLGAAAGPYSVAVLLKKGLPGTFWPMAGLIIMIAVGALFWARNEEMLPPELQDDRSGPSPAGPTHW